MYEFIFIIILMIACLMLSLFPRMVLLNLVVGVLTFVIAGLSFNTPDLPYKPYFQLAAMILGVVCILAGAFSARQGD